MRGPSGGRGTAKGEESIGTVPTPCPVGFDDPTEVVVHDTVVEKTESEAVRAAGEAVAQGVERLLVAQSGEPLLQTDVDVDDVLPAYGFPGNPPYPPGLLRPLATRALTVPASSLFEEEALS